MNLFNIIDFIFIKLKYIKLLVQIKKLLFLIFFCVSFFQFINVHLLEFLYVYL
jgi:hypothetical protein